MCAEDVAIVVNVALVALSAIQDEGAVRGGTLSGRKNIEDGRGQGWQKQGPQTDILEDEDEDEDEDEEGRGDGGNGGCNG